MQLSFTHDTATTVPIAGGDVSESDAATWGALAAENLVSHHDLDSSARDMLQQALREARLRSKTDVGQNIVIFEPTTRALTLLRVIVIERELGRDEQEAFLNPEAALPPRIWLTPSTPLGIGCSSSALVDTARNVGHLRWIFMPSGMTVLAMIEAVPSRALLLVGAIAERIFESMQVAGTFGEAAPGFDPVDLVERASKNENSWQI